MKKNISQNINYFGFIAILLAGIILTLKLPDVDRGLMSLIGHRSIITLFTHYSLRRLNRSHYRKLPGKPV